MEWISVKQQMPKNCKNVIACFKNRLGKKRIVIAWYAEKYTVEVNQDFDEYFEYDEDGDNFYLPEGWYEYSFGHDFSPFIGDRVDYWMPLPKPPNETNKQ